MMWIHKGLNSTIQARNTGLTIGAFDGVHRGHQALIRAMAASAHAAGWDAVVLTFDPLPRQVLGQGQSVLLSTLQERLALMEPLGVDGVVVLPFDEAIAATPAEDFVEALVTHLGLRELWVGPDFRLGRHREGDIPFLREMGARRGFALRVFEDTVLWESQPVRSSRIRRALRVGDVEQANGCLGRPYGLSGIVAHGDQRGRGLGFPTANLRVAKCRRLPANGVYVCRVTVPEGCFGAVTNVGTRPTFDHSQPLVEAHLLDYSGDLYGQPIQVDFLRRLRDEVKFPSVKALIAQMHADVKAARAWMGARGCGVCEV